MNPCSLSLTHYQMEKEELEEHLQPVEEEKQKLQPLQVRDVQPTTD